MESHPLVSIRTICTLLGVTSNQVHMWFQRRHTNGFPDMRAQVHQPQYPGDKRKAPLFDLMEVTEWWAVYDPGQNRGSHWERKALAAGKVKRNGRWYAVKS